jgi:hypothetical protein
VDSKEKSRQESLLQPLTGFDFTDIVGVTRHQLNFSLPGFGAGKPGFGGISPGNPKDEVVQIDTAGD